MVESEGYIAGRCRMEITDNVEVGICLTRIDAQVHCGHPHDMSITLTTCAIGLTCLDVLLTFN